MLTPAIALTIDVSTAPVVPLPADLQNRLCSSPKSPEELASELDAHSKRTEALRQAHLEAIKDRAARESQRAAEAIARRLRIAASKAEAVQKKIDTAANKGEAKKEAAACEREARKARREALAAAVKEARVAADEARENRAAALLSAEQLASAKHAKTVEQVKQRSAAEVQHAFAVAAAHKEKSALIRSSLSDKIHDKLITAELRRDLLASPSKALLATAGLGPVGTRMVLNQNLLSTASSTQKRTHHDILNDCKVEAAQRSLIFDAKMAKASEKHAAHIASVKERAANVITKAEAVVAQHKAKSDGIDEVTIEAKNAMYDKMVRAETARLFAIKAKLQKIAKQGDTVSVIIVKMNDSITPRAPPAALALRLATVSSSLVKTAAARQQGAAARRLLRKAAASQKAATAAARRAAAASRVAKNAAVNEAKITAKTDRAMKTLALGIGKRANVHAKEQKRINDVLLVRKAMDAGRKEMAAALTSKCDAATERHAAKLRLVAKAGVVAIRHARNTSRRNEASKAATERGAALKERCATAEAKRAALISKRIEVARKHQKAIHPRREMPDQEVKKA